MIAFLDSRIEEARRLTKTPPSHRSAVKMDKHHHWSQHIFRIDFKFMIWHELCVEYVCQAFAGGHTRLRPPLRSEDTEPLLNLHNGCYVIFCDDSRRGEMHERS